MSTVDCVVPVSLVALNAAVEADTAVVEVELADLRERLAEVQAQRDAYAAVVQRVREARSQHFTLWRHPAEALDVVTAYQLDRALADVPRWWVLPAEPGRDVDAVNDRDGYRWVRQAAPEGEDWWCRADDPDRLLRLDWYQLIARHHPLTADGPGPAGRHG